MTIKPGTFSLLLSTLLSICIILSEKEDHVYTCTSSIPASLSSYSHYVFATLDHDDTGVITFEVRNWENVYRADGVDGPQGPQEMERK